MEKYFKGLSEFWTFWNIDHIDGDPNNNSLENLQPMHVECNIKKN